MDRYQMQMAGQYGISHFYTFEKNVQNEGKLLSVPDGSVDLLFGLMGSRVHCFISGTVLRAKRWPLGGCDRYFGLRFMPGSVILPKDLSIEDLVDRDLEIKPDTYGTRLAGELLQAASLHERASLFLKPMPGCSPLTRTDRPPRRWKTTSPSGSANAGGTFQCRR